jgi:cytochrome c551/c552
MEMMDLLEYIKTNARGLKEAAFITPGNPREGGRIFKTKGCVKCHAIWGEGGKGGPDLGTLPKAYASQAQIAALMWNHGPEMWGRMTARKIPIEKMNAKEMANLFAFLYFLRYMDEPGNPEKGKQLMETKGCIKCHTIKEGLKEDLIRWSMYVNPIIWAQMMWNHTPQMEQEMKKKGLPWLGFQGHEMVDLIAYIRSLSTHVEKVYLQPGDPQTGKKLFSDKGCLLCHAPQGELDLTKKKDFPRTLAQVAGMMWNHSSEMSAKMKEKGMDRPPPLSPGDVRYHRLPLFNPIF